MKKTALPIFVFAILLFSCQQEKTNVKEDNLLKKAFTIQLVANGKIELFYFSIKSNGFQ